MFSSIISLVPYVFFLLFFIFSLITFFFTFSLAFCHFLFFFFFSFFKIYLFIYFWLCWVFVSVRGLSPVLASGGHSSSRRAGPSLPRPLPLRSTGSRRTGSVVVAHGPSRSAACGILPDQGSNPCAWHWQADSQPLRHQGSPCHFLKPTLRVSDSIFSWNYTSCCFWDCSWRDSSERSWRQDLIFLPRNWTWLAWMKTRHPSW